MLAMARIFTTPVRLLRRENRKLTEGEGESGHKNKVRLIYFGYEI